MSLLIDSLQQKMFRDSPEMKEVVVLGVLPRFFKAPQPKQTQLQERLTSLNTILAKKYQVSPASTSTETESSSSSSLSSTAVVKFRDVSARFLKGDGRPDESLYDDHVHLNKAGCVICCSSCCDDVIRHWRVSLGYSQLLPEIIDILNEFEQRLQS